VKGTLLAEDSFCFGRSASITYQVTVEKQYRCTCSKLTKASKTIVKPWKLTEDETFSSYTSWQQNMLYVLNQEYSNKSFLKPASVWLPTSAEDPVRGLTDEHNDGAKKEDKIINLNVMLGYVAQFAPHYLTREIIDGSTSINSVWHTLRAYYGFQQSETQFMKFASISWDGISAERPERLYRRILAHLSDNLLTADSKLLHNGKMQTKDEVLSPTVERLAVLKWMELIHPKLSALVARTFAYDLQRKTLKDLQPQICDGIEQFLEELNRDEVQASRVFASRKPHTSRGLNTINPQNHSAESARLKSVSFMATHWEIANSLAMKKSGTCAHSVLTYAQMSSQKWRTHTMSMRQKSRLND